MKRLPEHEVLLSWYLFHELDRQPITELNQIQTILREFKKNHPAVICVLLAKEYKEFQEQFFDEPCALVVDNKDEADLLIDTNIELPALFTLSENGLLTCWNIASTDPQVTEFAYNLERSGNAFLTGAERSWLEKRREALEKRQ